MPHPPGKTQPHIYSQNIFHPKRGPNVSHYDHHESQQGLGGRKKEGKREGKDKGSRRKDNQRPFPPFPVLPGHVTLCESPQVLCLGKYLPLVQPTSYLEVEAHDCFHSSPVSLAYFPALKTLRDEYLFE